MFVVSQNCAAVDEYLDQRQPQSLLHFLVGAGMGLLTL